MSRFLAALVTLVAGFGLGWFTRQATFDAPSYRAPRERAERRDPEPATRSAEELPVDTGESAPARDPRPSDGRVDDKESTPAESEDATVAEATAETEEAQQHPFEEMFRSMSPQWKAWSGMQVKQQVASILEGLGLDPHTAKEVEAALMAEAGRQIERVIEMMLGYEELDPDALDYFFGVPPELSQELDTKLAGILTERELARVKARVRETHEQQKRTFAEMQMGMMGIGDLDEGQKDRIRRVLTEKNLMRDQFLRFAEVSRDHERLRRMLQGEGLEEHVRRTMAPLRRRMEDILRHDQLEKYKAYEEMMIKQSRMQMKMMAPFLEKKEEDPSTEAESRGN